MRPSRTYRCGALQTAFFPSATLAEFYRFAVLLTGSIRVAEQVMAETFSEVSGDLAQFRNETSRQAWLAARIRERCLKNNSAAAPAPRLLREVQPGGKVEVLEIEAYLVAQRFHLLPEPERSALALFYLDFFTNEEIAKLLKLHEEELSDRLGEARRLLHEQLCDMRESAA